MKLHKKGKFIIYIYIYKKGFASMKVNLIVCKQWICHHRD